MPKTAKTRRVGWPTRFGEHIIVVTQYAINADPVCRIRLVPVGIVLLRREHACSVH